MALDQEVLPDTCFDLQIIDVLGHVLPQQLLLLQQSYEVVCKGWLALVSVELLCKAVVCVRVLCEIFKVK